MMAYAQAYGGDLDAARASAADYSRLVPDDPNAPDSLGEIEFLDGNFAAAEKLFLTAHEMNAAWRESGPLLKAAHARVMTGDVAGADGLVGRYLELRKSVNDPLIPYRQAQWEFVTGRRRQAMERLQSFRAAASGDVAAHAAAQLAAWKRQTGDLTGARQMAIEALKQGTTPPTRSLAALVTFVTEPPASASECAVRAEQAFSQPADNTIRRYALAYALLFEGHFREASVLLKQMLRQTLPSLAGDLRTLTAWALIESGQTEDARAIGNLYPVPEAQGERTFSALAMPRVLQVRARLLEQQGQKDQAARLRAVYEKLKGDIPDAR